jgi:hypothetical protein
VPGGVVGIADARQPPAPTLSPSDVSLAPTAIDFPQTAVGPTSDPLAVTITNVSDHAVPLFLSTPAPTPESEFGSGGTTCGGSLARGAACTVSYVFHPTSGGTKLGTATIRVANAEHTISLTGAGLTGFVVTPQKLTFAKTKVGAVSAGQAVTIVNASGITRPLNLSVTGLGNDFRASNGCGTTLGVGATCTVTFAFAPTAGGTRTANPAISLAGTANPIALAGVGFVDNAFTFRSAKASKGKLALALVFPGPGRVSVAAITKVKTKVKGKVRIKTVTYGSLRNVSVRKGSKSLSVSPSKTGAALLKRAKRLQLTVKVTFTPTGGTAAARSRTVTATLK